MALGRYFFHICRGLASQSASQGSSGFVTSLSASTLIAYCCIWNIQLPSLSSLDPAWSYARDAHRQRLSSSIAHVASCGATALVKLCAHRQQQVVRVIVHNACTWQFTCKPNPVCSTPQCFTGVPLSKSVGSRRRASD